MALPVDLTLNLKEAADSISANMDRFSETNSCDVAIAAQICSVVFYVSLMICITVVICILARMLYKAYVKKKDHELEWEQIKDNQTIWGLQQKLDITERDIKRKSDEWEIGKAQELLNLNKEKSDLEYEKNKEIIKIQKERNALDHERIMDLLKLLQKKNEADHAKDEDRR